MNKILCVLIALVVVVFAGCAPIQPPATDQEVSSSEYSDEEVIVESDDGVSPEEMRLREGDGYMMNLVDSYTIPVAEGDSEATPDQVLIDSSGKEYKIVNHIGPDTPQE